MIRDLATDPEKRALFTRLAKHLGTTLAGEIEAAIASQLSGDEGASSVGERGDTSSADAQRQMQGQPTAALEAQGAKAKAADDGC